MLELARKRVEMAYIKEVYRFVQEASKLRNPPMVYQESMAIPATSLIGMFTIDPSEPFIVEYDKNAKDFENYISRYEC